jgi:hypothetical protein
MILYFLSTRFEINSGMLYGKHVIQKQQPIMRISQA